MGIDLPAGGRYSVGVASVYVAPKGGYRMEIGIQLANWLAELTWRRCPKTAR
jgi:hypothetical protein